MPVVRDCFQSTGVARIKIWPSCGRFSDTSASKAQKLGSRIGASESDVARGVGEGNYTLDAVYIGYKSY